MTEQLNCVETKLLQTSLSPSPNSLYQPNQVARSLIRQKTSIKIPKKRKLQVIKNEVRKKEENTDNMKDPPICDYVKFCMAKRKRDTSKLDSLGVICATLKPKENGLRKRCTHIHADII